MTKERKAAVQKIQGKLRQFVRLFAPGVAKPRVKFLRDMVRGILIAKSPIVTEIARGLAEAIPLKKTIKRLDYHLRKEGLYRQISEIQVTAHTSALERCRYLLVDLSDLQRSYSSRQEGIAQVYDGSTGKTGPGFWLCNAAGVTSDGQRIIPAYSELYSLKEEATSENRKILEAIDTVQRDLETPLISVFDRGGDRSMLMRPLIRAHRPFIIRQVGDRTVYYQGQPILVDVLSAKVHLSHTFRVKKIHKHRPIEHTYRAGILPVQLDPNGVMLWLMVTHRRGKGRCFFLGYLPKITDAIQALFVMFEGYGLRWKIEEVHRHVKVAYHWEAIAVEKYVKLKNLNAVFWLAISFVYARLKGIAHKLILAGGVALLSRLKLLEITGFVYYKLSNAVAILLAWATPRPHHPKPPSRRKAIQLQLPLNC
jgi:hypothetical protein